MRSPTLSEFELSATDQHRLDQFYEDITTEAQRFLGYPCNGHAQTFGTQEATQALSHLEYQSVSEDALLVQLDDRPGALADLLKTCRSGAVPLRSIRLLWRGKGKGVVAIATAAPQRLKQLLHDQVLLS